MATIKCIITYPDQFISNIGEFEINFGEAIEEITGTGKLKVTRENVNVNAMLHISGLLFGPENAICSMDVFIDDEKVNLTPVKSRFKSQAGVQLFNWRL